MQPTSLIFFNFESYGKIARKEGFSFPLPPGGGRAGDGG